MRGCLRLNKLANGGVTHRHVISQAGETGNSQVSVIGEVVATA